MGILATPTQNRICFYPILTPWIDVKPGSGSSRKTTCIIEYNRKCGSVLYKRIACGPATILDLIQKMLMIKRLLFLTALMVVVLALVTGLLMYLVPQHMVLSAQVVPSPMPTIMIRPTASARPSPSPTHVPPSATPQPLANAASWFPASVVSPSATPTATDTATATPIPTETPIPSPTIVPQSFSATLEPGEGAFMHNVLTALNANGGALRRIVVPPGATFSFIATLGPRPHLLPWRDVYVNLGYSDQLPATAFYAVQPDYIMFTQSRQRLNDHADQPTLPVTQIEIATQVPIATPQPRPTVHITIPSGPDAQPLPFNPMPAPHSVPLPVPLPEAEPESEPESRPIEPPPRRPSRSVPVLGGGVCDLASRYVIAARPFLPPNAFQFKLHPNGLSGIRYQDAVSIWFDGGYNDLDLRITNTTDRWLIFEATVNGGIITVTAILQGQPESRPGTSFEDVTPLLPVLPGERFFGEENIFPLTPTP